MLEIIIIALFIALDQVFKVVCANWLTALPGNSYPLWKDVFHLTYVENRGAAFGMLQNARWLFIIVTILACIAIAYWLIKKHKGLHTLMRISLSLIIAGALGNLIDRVLLGYVRDMFSFVLINFAVFNVADSAVSIGTVLLIFDLLFYKGKKYLQDEPKKEKAHVQAHEDDNTEDEP
ncbi:MAG TPA: signal peptidase II [Clostridia bacterium]|nr:signal peptidase II [Clostridia bacterium]